METSTTKVLPVIPMRTQVVFPNTAIAFDAERGATVAVNRGDSGDKYIFLTLQRGGEGDLGELCRVGTVVRIRQLVRASADRVRVFAEGVYRACASEFRIENGCIVAEAEELVTIHGDMVMEEAAFRTAKALARDLALSYGGSKLNEWEQGILCHTDADTFINTCSQRLSAPEEKKQELLEENRIVERLKLLAVRLNEELEIDKLSKQIDRDVRKNIDKTQREYYLREQLRAIHHELGDDAEEADSLRERLLAKGLPPLVEEKALAELARMDRMPSSSPEYTVLRNYADWLLDLPWHEETEDTQDLSEVERILEEDHYGLEKIKERVVEYLAVLQLTGTLHAPILCFVGPPGVGKTSIAKSIARALGRKFVRMSLGGVKDESEIRGHRRTYIGAMPGRILYEMKNARTVNPVFLLDEVDKISADLRGDPASALLEVLDPEQNSTFRDRYLEVEYDLSKVMFIATANTLDTIPPPLRDRMEIIELSGYTAQEKEEIARRYLVPKKMKENGITEEQFCIEPDVIGLLIEGYTMEAGVRNLERTIGSVCRKAAVQIAKGEVKSVTVTGENLESILGARRYSRDEALEKDEVGTATGLAWTAVGGTTLDIEVSLMPGKGEIVLTGQLGDVMRESARAAITYIHAHADSYGIPQEAFSGQDIHVHVPEGATPKDGPSAGITMATAIVSAFTGSPVRKDVAMTGEITLRGKVLPIGGLKEKALAADRIGIHDIIIPQKNKKDLEEIPQMIRDRLHFICVENVAEVFRAAIVGWDHAD